MAKRGTKQNRKGWVCADPKHALSAAVRLLRWQTRMRQMRPSLLAQDKKSA
jgi:hypothetical protein